MIELPDHLSPSSLYSYNECPRGYYLSRVKKAEGLPAWYFVVGTTVHRFIEDHVRSTVFSHSLPAPDGTAIFMEEVRKARLIEPRTDKWLHGGSDDEPVVEERALRLALDCIENALVFLDDFTPWEVEYDASGFLPHCTMEIKCYIDMIGDHKRHGPMIVDFKTGKTKPKNNDQLETYNARLMSEPDAPFMEHGSMRFKGLWVMLNPGARKARPITFKETPDTMGRKYLELQRKVESKVADPNPGYGCRWCTMKPNCKTQSGMNKRTAYYDTPVKDGWYPF